ncbi:efflux transporter outer membrane subunit [Pseudomonas yamanorum]|uniref:Efflux transporter outer membrane subunit n=1 Tax=Pseudomonas yamanorum TaxID=515393 RepID=A0ABU1CXE1_9PSED|nr:efflux transporter outer membrane subunit [Pseudomonas yamanorum]MDR0191947.1 efflux transporter outer membrane subunit [Pseudomonas yamanorum]
MNTSIKYFTPLLLSLSMAGCMVGPDYSAPKPPEEQHYLADPQQEALLNNGQALREDWWALLDSPDLNLTVERALAQNGSLVIARANLAKAREGVAMAAGGRLPQVDAGASMDRTKVGATSFGPQAVDFPIFSAYGAGFSVTYDLDLFGGEQRQVEMATANAQVEQQALNAVHLEVSGNAVSVSLRMAVVSGQIKAVTSVIDADQHILEMVQRAVSAGAAAPMDVTLAQSQLDRDRARLPSLNQALEVNRGTLTTLVGSTETRWTAPDFDLEKLQLPANIPVVVPSELVRLRPDIRAAEARLQAANAWVGVTTSDLYPHLNLSANLSDEALFSGPANSAWSLIGGLAGPVFHGGTLSARKRAAEDAYQATLAAYQQTVLRAFQQVSVSMHGLQNAADEVRAQKQALDSANTALRLTQQAYWVGSAGVVQVMQTQRTQQLAKVQLVQAVGKQYLETVNLFLAMGGGTLNRVL